MKPMTTGSVEIWEAVRGVIIDHGLDALTAEAANDVLDLFIDGCTYCFFVNHEGTTSEDTDRMFDQIAEVIKEDSIAGYTMFYDYGYDYDGVRDIAE